MLYLWTNGIFTHRPPIRKVLLRSKGQNDQIIPTIQMNHLNVNHEQKRTSQKDRCSGVTD